MTPSIFWKKRLAVLTKDSLYLVRDQGSTQIVSSILPLDSSSIVSFSHRVLLPQNFEVFALDIRLDSKRAIWTLGFETQDMLMSWMQALKSCIGQLASQKDTGLSKTHRLRDILNSPTPTTPPNSQTLPSPLPSPVYKGRTQTTTNDPFSPSALSPQYMSQQQHHYHQQSNHLINASNSPPQPSSFPCFPTSTTASSHSSPASFRTITPVTLRTESNILIEDTVYKLSDTSDCDTAAIQDTVPAVFWKQRYAVLTEDALYLFRDHGVKQVVTSILPLSASSIISFSQALPPNFEVFALDIREDDKRANWTLIFETHDTLISWMQMLKSCISQLASQESAGLSRQSKDMLNSP